MSELFQSFKIDPNIRVIIANKFFMQQIKKTEHDPNIICLKANFVEF